MEEDLVDVHHAYNYSMEESVEMLLFGEYLKSVQCAHLREDFSACGVTNPEQCAALTVAELCHVGAGGAEVRATTRRPTLPAVFLCSGGLSCLTWPASLPVGGEDMGDSEQI